VRIIGDTDLQAVTPDAHSKTHFIIVDCVGVCEQDLSDSPSLERKPTIPLHKLLNTVAYGSIDLDVLSSLAGRLARLDREIGVADRQALAQTAGGLTLKDISGSIVTALEPDRHIEAARLAGGLAFDATPSDEQVAKARRELLKHAALPLASNPALRQQIERVQQRAEQTIDTVSKDAVLEATYSEAARDHAKATVTSFEQFIRDNKDQITALQVLYSRPYAERLRLGDIKQLAETIKAPPRSWTPETLWRSYEALDRSKVRGSGGRVLTDIVSLVRYALRQETELEPFPRRVEERFEHWLAEQKGLGRQFTDEQLQWLQLIRDHVGGSLAIERDDFEYPPFVQHGGLGKVYQIFGSHLDPLLDELNRVLVA